MKKVMMMLALLFSSSQLMAQQTLGEVVGEVVDGKEVAVYDAHVFILDQGRKYQAKTDYNGRFRISGVPAGTYMANIRIEKDTLPNIVVEVPMDGFANMGVIKFDRGVKEFDAVFVDTKGKKLVDGNLPVASLDYKQIQNMPNKFDVKSLITTMSSEVRQTADGSLVFRGARKGDMIYIIDGVKTRDAGSIPSVSIGRMQLYTGGLPAKYGDTLGGVVVMESKSYFDLYRSWYAEQLKAGKIN